MSRARGSRGEEPLAIERLTAKRHVSGVIREAIVQNASRLPVGFNAPVYLARGMSRRLCLDCVRVHHVSIDGGAIAEEDDGRRFEVVARHFDERATLAGAFLGIDPVWSSKGDELFYFDGKSLVAARVSTASSFAVQSSLKLFDAPYQFGRIVGANFNVTPDGKRFILSTTPHVRRCRSRWC